MSHEHLLASLRLKGEEQAREIWRQAEKQAEKIRVEAADRLAKEKILSDREQAAAVGRETAALLLEGERQARQIRTMGKHRLAEHLFQLGKKSLPALREESPEKVFSALATELPPLPWEVIRVNPGDRELARKCFPKAQIEIDPDIAGGLEAMTQGGGVRICNTLGKRLAHVWPDLLPVLLRELTGEGAQP